MEDCVETHTIEVDPVETSSVDDDFKFPLMDESEGANSQSSLSEKDSQNCFREIYTTLDSGKSTSAILKLGLLYHKATNKIKRTCSILKSSSSLRKCSNCDFNGPSETEKIFCDFNGRNTRENLHKCPQCDYQFAQMGLLILHVKSKHSLERPFKCMECNYGTVSKSIDKKNLSNVQNVIIELLIKDT